MTQLWVAQLDSDDEAYRWLLLWLADHPSFKTSHSYQVTSSMHKCVGIPHVTWRDVGVVMR